MTYFLNCKPQAQYVLSASVSDRFLTPNVETRSSLSNCVAGPAGMRLLWGFPEGDCSPPCIPAGPAHPHPTPRQPFTHSWQLHTRLHRQLHACSNHFTSCAVVQMCQECVRCQVSKTLLRRTTAGPSGWPCLLNNLWLNYYFIMLFHTEARFR